MQVEYKLFGKHVETQPSISVAIVVSGFFFILALALSPLLLPLHFALKKKGLKGFYIDRHIWIGKESFARRVSAVKTRDFYSV